MSTTASILFAIGVVLWRAYEDRRAATDRAGIKAEQAEQRALLKSNEQVIQGIQYALAQCDLITYPTPYDNDPQRTA